MCHACVIKVAHGARFAMCTHQAGTTGIIAMRNRNTGKCQTTDSAGYTGYDFKWYMGLRQCLCFFPDTTEHTGVPSLEPYNRISPGRLLNHQTLNLLLCHGMLPCLFANINAVTVLWCKCQDFRIQQTIIQNAVRFLNHPHRTQCQQLPIAAAGSGKINHRPSSTFFRRRCAASMAIACACALGPLTCRSNSLAPSSLP